MEAFYTNVIGLTKMSGGHEQGIVFFCLNESPGGHRAVLALFRNDVNMRDGLHPTTDSAPVTGGQSSLHHLALSLPWEEQDAVMAWYDSLGQTYRVEHFDWIGWRGIFTEDPEGNTVELVAKDPRHAGPPTKW